jgi:hypothetical protein
MSQPAITSTTQDFLDIFDITNDMVFMKDGSAAAILIVSAMNFSLLAEEEQDAVIYAYAALLNSLNFQVQINIQSKTKDATAYLDLLRIREEEASSQDKKKRISRYREFVGQLIQERNVLDKKFYVVLPAAPIELGIVPPQSMIPGGAQLDMASIEKNTLLEKAAGVLQPRVDHLIGQFNRIGLYARQFSTQEIIQNYYNNYNPEAVEGQQITDTSDYTTPLVQASVFGASVKNRQQVIQQFTNSLAEAEKNIGQNQVVQDFAQEPTTPVSELSTNQAEQPTELEVAQTTQSFSPEPFSSAQQNPTTPEGTLQNNPTPDLGAEVQPVASTASAPADQPTQPTPTQTYSLPPVAEIK